MAEGLPYNRIDALSVGDELMVLTDEGEKAAMAARPPRFVGGRGSNLGRRRLDHDHHVFRRPNIARAFDDRDALAT